ncbi:MAG: hypothetical protein JXB17_13740 [Bacteroidales bacterium]|nr:hypothetical protein [Bacteroidales bacterium]
MTNYFKPYSPIIRNDRANIYAGYLKVTKINIVVSDNISILHLQFKTYRVTSPEDI